MRLTVENLIQCLWDKVSDSICDSYITKVCEILFICIANYHAPIIKSVSQTW